MTRIKLSPVGPFSLSNSTILSPYSGPSMVFGPAGEGVDYVCYNCMDVLIQNKTDNVKIDGNVLIQCSKCTAYNHFDDPATPVALPDVDLTHYKLAAPFRIPLGIGQTQMFGYFSAVWGQIDEMALVCIAKLMDTKISAASKLLDAQTSGPRINLLYSLTKDHADPLVKKIGKSVHTKMSALITKRNHLMHGIWGYLRDEDNKLVPACHYSKSTKPILASDLMSLGSDASKQAHELKKLLFYLLGRPAPPELGHPESAPPFIFVEGSNDIPRTWSQLCDEQPQPPSPQSDADPQADQ